MNLTRLLSLGVQLPSVFALVAAGPLLSCKSGKRWVKAPLFARDNDQGVRLMESPEQRARTGSSSAGQAKSQTETTPINAPAGPLGHSEFADAPGARPDLQLTGTKKRVLDGPVDGRLLGVFRNTYYDFPSESAFSGPSIPLMNQKCQPIADVPKDFYDAVCMQGSGMLITGQTVSFAKRDCACAAVCPRSNQKICFDQLDQKEFPWGRGAQGTSITPLRTVAVDSNVIPLGTKIYILEYDGVPRTEGGARHDGCFVAEDRGLKVKGEHVDIFSGNARATEHLNQAVPSNRGVHIYVGTARCD